MFKHILVSVDGSERSEQAIPYAIEIAPHGAKITLLYIVEIPLCQTIKQLFRLN
jgi:nucleotide-binding universal stress UspA family protein